MLKKYVCLFVLLCVVASITACEANPNASSFSEEKVDKYYSAADFKNIVIGESTYRDVYETASTETMYITSYGGYCEYPIKDGGCVRIKFNGADLVVSEIEVIN